MKVRFDSLKVPDKFAYESSAWGFKGILVKIKKRNNCSANALNIDNGECYAFDNDDMVTKLNVEIVCKKLTFKDLPSGSKFRFSKATSNVNCRKLKLMNSMAVWLRDGGDTVMESDAIENMEVILVD